MASSDPTAATSTTAMPPIWIDSTTKGLLKRVADDATVLTTVLFNTPTVGCFHTQQHVITRGPKLVEEGRLIAKRANEQYECLRKDVTFAAEFAANTCSASQSMSSIKASVAQMTSMWTALQQCRSVNPTLPQPHVNPEQSVDNSSSNAPAAGAPPQTIVNVDAAEPELQAEVRCDDVVVESVTGEVQTPPLPTQDVPVPPHVAQDEIEA